MFDFMDFDGSAEAYEQPAGPYVPDAADCMRCGLCLSHCPTYQLSHDEQEGPRQRVRTLERQVVKQQAVDEKALEHLQSCILCRACESVCPSHMDYAELYEQAEIKISADRHFSFYGRTALKIIEDKRLLKAALPLIKLYQSSGLRALFRKTGLLDLIGLKRVDNISPQATIKKLKPFYPVPSTQKISGQGTVALFTGCVSEHFDRVTLDSAIQVLNKIGYAVLVPEQQVCCGAIHYHNGDRETAKRLMRKNSELFDSLAIDGIVYCATGCGSQLQDYPRLLEIDEQTSAGFKDKLFEISDFVDQHWPQSLTLKALEKKLCVHEPCSQRNVLKNQQAVYRLLKRIPALEINELEDNHLCCGAGGSYMLTHPDKADALRDLKCKHIQNSHPDYVATSNIGCALHLASAEPSTKPADIVHPIQLIAALLDE